MTASDASSDAAPPPLITGLDFRQRAALALLSPPQRTWLNTLDPLCFANGLMVLDFQNRGIDGRSLWLSGVAAVHQFVENPDIFLEWIRTADLTTLDAFVALILDFRQGRCASTEHINPSLWANISQASQNYERLGLEALDYPTLVDAVKRGQTAVPQD